MNACKLPPETCDLQSEIIRMLLVSFQQFSVHIHDQLSAFTHHDTKNINKS